MRTVFGVMRLNVVLRKYKSFELGVQTLCTGSTNPLYKEYMPFVLHLCGLLLLMITGISGAQADDITVTIAGLSDGSITKSVNQTTREVTLTVQPNNGYYIKASDIKVEPLVGTGNANAPRRVPDLANLIAGKLYDPNRDNREISTFVGDGNHSAEYKFTVPTNYDGAYVTATFRATAGGGVTLVTSENSIGANPDMGGHYILMDDVPASWLANLYDTNNAFTGKLEGEAKSDGTYPKIDMTSYSHALFNMIDGGTVRNIVLENVDITNGTNVGAIANQVIGIKTKIACIYNCGILTGSVSGSGNVGGLVGQLGQTENNNNCYARVINCYSYANVSGGSNAGGLVGYNSYASKASDIRTMVMNCMFYGDIKSGTNVSPVFGGENINNLNSGGLNTFNFYAYDKATTFRGHAENNNKKYNCALAVENRFLTRFELYRQLLNSNKKLAAIYITGNASDDNLLAKWVLETADRSISGREPYPYPILKAQGYYPSIINYDTRDLANYSEEHRKEGLKTGTLAVTIRRKSQKTTGGQDWPTTSDVQKTRLNLTRTDMDFDRFNFNYDKVQLPFYNDVGTGNYTDGKVVTGWKITSITGGTAGTYNAADSWGGYNFADRKCTNKDLYSVSGRVFSQGAYFDVPYGVTDIEIEPYWGNAAYIADQRYDVVYNGSYGRQDVSQLGTQASSSTTFGGKAVKTSINDALGTITSPGTTVYDNAIVLVGNFHQNVIKSKEPFNSGNTPFTIMSVDADHDNEPDYSLIFHDNNRSRVNPIRFDFLNIPGTAQAQKPNGTSTILNTSVFNASAWFEITNTCLIYFSQFEYENSSKTSGKSPIILLGGVYDQFVSTKVNKVEYTTYLHVGGNAWFKDFGNGTHSDGSKSTKHIPISVTGGEYEGFYLTGTYNSDAAVSSDDAECYISSGHFKELAGAGLEQINGNVQWQIYDADIDNFFGGGINEIKPIRGTITTDIFNSHVGTFCGGPKFGNMVTGKQVTTTAEGCTFDNFFGAGYGGNSYNRKKYFDNTTFDFNTLQEYYYKSDGTGDRGKYFDGESTELRSHDNVLFGYKGKGVATDFDYEFFVWTSGKAGARFFVKFVAFSLAQCDNVVSTLTGCTINQNFYGGGSLGKVVGTATSTLEDCKVKGNVFGAGYSATLPQISVRSEGFTTNPKFNNNSGMFEPGVFSDTEDFDWKHVDNYPSNGNTGLSNDGVITTVNIEKSNLGSVGGHVTLTLKDTTVGTSEADASTKGTGNVFGGGDESYVTNTTARNASTVINITGDTEIFGNVFGGGNKGLVSGNATVNIITNDEVQP